MDTKTIAIWAIGIIFLILVLFFLTSQLGADGILRSSVDNLWGQTGVPEEIGQNLNIRIR